MKTDGAILVLSQFLSLFIDAGEECYTVDCSQVLTGWSQGWGVLTGVEPGLGGVDGVEPGLGGF